jgi:hypothetical protein
MANQKVTTRQSLEKDLDTSMERGRFYDSQIGRQVVGAVCQSLADVLNIAEEGIYPNVRLVEDLNAQSIDGIDITLRIEKELELSLNKYGNLLETGEHEQQTVLGLVKIVYEAKAKSESEKTNSASGKNGQ